MQIVKIAAFIAPFALWFYITEEYGVRGNERYCILAFAVATGVALGYYDLPHGLSKRFTPKWRTIGVVVMLLATTVSFLYANRGETGRTGTSSALDTRFANRPASETAPVGDKTTLGETIRVKTKQLGEDVDILTDQVADTNMKEGIRIGVKKGKKEAYDPPRKFGRSTADIKPVLIGTNKWRICFQTPGPAMIETGLPIKQGDTYYIKMDKEAESIQFGWLGEDEHGRTVFAPLQVPANVLVDSVPFKYTKSSQGNAQLAFNVATIPDGRYEIEITKSQFLLRPGEYAPGTPSRNRW